MLLLQLHVLLLLFRSREYSKLILNGRIFRHIARYDFFLFRSTSCCATNNILLLLLQIVLLAARACNTVNIWISRLIIVKSYILSHIISLIDCRLRRCFSWAFIFINYLRLSRSIFMGTSKHGGVSCSIKLSSGRDSLNIRVDRNLIFTIGFRLIWNGFFWIFW